MRRKPQFLRNFIPSIPYTKEKYPSDNDFLSEKDKLSLFENYTRFFHFYLLVIYGESLGLKSNILIDFWLLGSDFTTSVINIWNKFINCDVRRNLLMKGINWFCKMLSFRVTNTRRAILKFPSIYVKKANQQIISPSTYYLQNRVPNFKRIHRQKAVTYIKHKSTFHMKRRCVSVIFKDSLWCFWNDFKVPNYTEAQQVSQCLSGVWVEVPSHHVNTSLSKRGER